jgi:AraC-like DNA-binding protein
LIFTVDLPVIFQVEEASGDRPYHHHFKSITAMSPLQFQKQIRLEEARRLMLGEDLDAASAGFRVGYEDAAYFSCDYKRLFGAPPQRGIARFRNKLEL